MTAGQDMLFEGMFVSGQVVDGVATYLLMDPTFTFLTNGTQFDIEVSGNFVDQIPNFTDDPAHVMSTGNAVPKRLTPGTGPESSCYVVPNLTTTWDPNSINPYVCTPLEGYWVITIYEDDAPPDGVKYYTPVGFAAATTSSLLKICTGSYSKYQFAMSVQLNTTNPYTYYWEMTISKTVPLLNYSPCTVTLTIPVGSVDSKTVVIKPKEKAYVMTGDFNDTTKVTGQTRPILVDFEFPPVPPYLTDPTLVVNAMELPPPAPNGTINGYMTPTSATRALPGGFSSANRFNVQGDATDTVNGVTIFMPVCSVINTTPSICTVSNVLTSHPGTIVVQPQGGCTQIAYADLPNATFTFNGSFVYTVPDTGAEGYLTFKGDAASADSQRYYYAQTVNGTVAPIKFGITKVDGIMTLSLPQVMLVNVTELPMWTQSIASPKVMIAADGHVNYALVDLTDITHNVLTLRIARTVPSDDVIRTLVDAGPSEIDTIEYTLPPVTSRTFYVGASSLGNPYIPSSTVTPQTSKTTSSLVQLYSRTEPVSFKNNLTTGEAATGATPATYLQYKGDAAGGTTFSTQGLSKAYSDTFARYNSRFLCNGGGLEDGAYTAGGVVFISLPTISIENNTTRSLNISGLDGIPIPIEIPPVSFSTSAPSACSTNNDTCCTTTSKPAIVCALHVPVADLPFIRVKVETGSDESTLNLPAFNEGVSNANKWLSPNSDMEPPTALCTDPTTCTIKEFMISSDFSTNVRGTLIATDCSSCKQCSQDCCVTSDQTYEDAPQYCKVPDPVTQQIPLTPSTKPSSSCPPRPTAVYNGNPPCTGCINCGDYQFPTYYEARPPLVLVTGANVGVTNPADMMDVNTFCISGKDKDTPYFNTLIPGVEGGYPINLSGNVFAGFSVNPITTFTPVTKSGTPYPYAAYTPTTGAGACLLQTYSNTTTVWQIMPDSAGCGVGTATNSALCKDWYGTWGQLSYTNPPPTTYVPVPIGIIHITRPIVTLTNTLSVPVTIRGLYNTPSAGITIKPQQSYSLCKTDYAAPINTWTLEIDSVVYAPPDVTDAQNPYITAIGVLSNPGTARRYMLTPPLTFNSLTDDCNEAVTLVDSLASCLLIGAIQNNINAQLPGSTTVYTNVTVVANNTAVELFPPPGAEGVQGLNTAALCLPSSTSPPNVTFTVADDSPSSMVLVPTGSDKNYKCDGNTSAKWTYFCTPSPPNLYGVIVWSITRASNLASGEFQLQNNLNVGYEVWGYIYNGDVMPTPPTGCSGTITSVTSCTSTESTCPGINASATPVEFIAKSVNVLAGPAFETLTKSQQCPEVNGLTSIPLNTASTAVAGLDNKTVWCNAAQYKDEFRPNSVLSMSLQSVTVDSKTGSQVSVPIPNTLLCAVYNPQPAPCNSPADIVLACTSVGKFKVTLTTPDFQHFYIDAPFPLGQQYPTIPPLQPNQVVLYNTLVSPVTWTLSEGTPSTGSAQPYDMTVITFPPTATAASPCILQVQAAAYTLAVRVGVGYGSKGGVPCVKQVQSGKTQICSLVPLSADANTTQYLTLAKVPKQLCYILSAPAPLGTNPVILPAGGMEVIFVNRNPFSVTVTKNQDVSLDVPTIYDPNGYQKSFVLTPIGTVGNSVHIVGFPATTYTFTAPSLDTVTTQPLSGLIASPGTWTTTSYIGQVIHNDTSSPVIMITVPDMATYIDFQLVSKPCPSQNDTTLITAPFNNQSVKLVRNSPDPSVQSGVLIFYGDNASTQPVMVKQGADTYTLQVKDFFIEGAQIHGGALQVVERTANTSIVNVNCIWNITLTLSWPCSPLDSNFQATINTYSEFGSQDEPSNTVILTNSNKSYTFTSTQPGDSFNVTPSYFNIPQTATKQYSVATLSTWAVGSAIDGTLYVKSQSPTQLVVICSPPSKSAPGIALPPSAVPVIPTGPRKLSVTQMVGIGIGVLIGAIVLGMLIVVLYRKFKPAPSATAELLSNYNVIAYEQ